MPKYVYETDEPITECGYPCPFYKECSEIGFCYGINSACGYKHDLKKLEFLDGTDTIIHPVWCPIPEITLEE